MFCKSKTQFISCLNALSNEIYTIDKKIWKLSRNKSKKDNKQVEWIINRLNWYKNRLVFLSIFILKVIPKKILAFINNIESLDLNLIRIWKNEKYRNACSTKSVLTRTCRISIFFRKITSALFIQKSTGCICCADVQGLNEPIWWDEENKIRCIFNLKIQQTNFSNSFFSNYIIKNNMKPKYNNAVILFIFSLKKKEFHLFSIKNLTLFIFYNINKKNKSFRYIINNFMKIF
nr:G10 protein, predict nuclear transcrption regulator [Cryptomonas sp.]